MNYTASYKLANLFCCISSRRLFTFAIKFDGNCKKKKARKKGLETKLQQIEQKQALSQSGIENKLSENDTTIDLMRGEYRGQLKAMRDYIRSLELKIKQLDAIPIVIEKKDNITLEIIES